MNQLPLGPQGFQGFQGNVGSNGGAGAQGFQGNIGSQILYGVNSPLNTQGTTNDTYIETAVENVYKKGATLTWNITSAPTSVSWRSVASDSTGTKIVAAIYGSGIYISTDSGANWTIQLGAPSFGAITNWVAFGPC